MPSRKRSSQDSDSHPLPLREKRQKANQISEANEHVDVVPQYEQTSPGRPLRSNTKAKAPIPLPTAPEFKQHRPSSDQSSNNKSGQKSHVKFGSESPPPPQTLEAKEHEPAVVKEEGDGGEEDDESDDDEAPEAVSTSNAAARTKANKVEEGRILKQREQDEKDRRRKRDKQLKSQVKKSEKRRSRAEREQEQQSDDESGPLVSDRPKQMSRYDLDNLPDLLPEELLATEAPARLPTPPPPGKKANKVQGFMDALLGSTNDQVTADVIHEGTKIRVLQTTNTLLPPKANGETRQLRDAWLKGRASFEKADKRGSKVSQFRRRAGPQAFV